MREQTGARPKIAHFGAFDHDSYGDQIFPLLVEYFLPDFDFTHVSPTGGSTPWPDAKSTISVADAIAKEDWDGVMIGGGDIVQSGEWATKAWAQTSLLSLGALPSLWCGASLLAAKLNIPCVWNCPGVPREIPSQILSIATKAVRSVEYICLRDSLSAERLNRLLTRPVSVAPDTALNICDLWPAAEEKNREKAKPLILSLMPSDVIHRWDEIEALLELFGKRSDFSGEAIIVPLMGWQSDNGLLSPRLKSKSGFTVTIKDRSLSLQECALEIANGLAYAGNSLHGLITAVSYGVPAVLVKPIGCEATTKYEGFAEHFRTTGAQLVANSFTEAGNILATKPQLTINAASNRLRTHWAQVRDTLLRKNEKDKSAIWKMECAAAYSENETALLHGVNTEGILSRAASFNLEIADRDRQIATLNHIVADRDGQIENINRTVVVERDRQIANLSHTITERDGQITNLYHTIADRDGQIINLSHAVAEGNGQIAKLSHLVADLNGQIAKLSHVVSELNGQIENFSNSIADRDGQIINLNHAVAEGYEQIANLSNTIAARDKQIEDMNQSATERDDAIVKIWHALHD